MLILSLHPWPQITRMSFCNHVAGRRHHWVEGAERAVQDFHRDGARQLGLLKEIPSSVALFQAAGKAVCNLIATIKHRLQDDI